MNAHTPITAAPASPRQAETIAQVARLHEAVGDVLAALTRSGGRWSTNAMLADLAAAKVAAEVWTAHSLEEEIANLEQELGIGRGGLNDPLVPGFDPGMVHPDDGCRRKGLVW